MKTEVHRGARPGGAPPARTGTILGSQLATPGSAAHVTVEEDSPDTPPPPMHAAASAASTPASVYQTPPADYRPAYLQSPFAIYPDGARSFCFVLFVAVYLICGAIQT